MMRLDKFLVHTNAATRSEAKSLIKAGRVLVNGEKPKAPDLKIDEYKDSVTLDGKPLSYEEFSYFMLNKPAGVVTACEDKRERTVMDLFEKEPCRGLSPVGRLDKDTVGLLLVTNDGALSHRLLAPGKHVWKKYYVELSVPITAEAGEKLCRGLDIGDDTPTLPARLEAPDGTEPVYPADKLVLSIHEGRFHQVKRMFEAVGSSVICLKRVSFGPLTLDETLKEGEYKKLSPEVFSDL